MKYLYIIILMMMIGYIGLNMYFDYRMEKKIKEYKKRLNDWDKKNNE